MRGDATIKAGSMVEFAGLPAGQRVFSRVRFVDLFDPMRESEPVVGTFKTAPLAEIGQLLRHRTPLTRLRQPRAAGTPAPEVSSLDGLARCSVLRPRALGFLRTRRNPQTRGSKENIMNTNVTVAAPTRKR